MKDFNSPHSSATAAVSTVRNRTMKVGKRLEKSAGTIRGHALAELERAKWGGFTHPDWVDPEPRITPDIQH
jgi:hypothetical protein